VQQAARASQQRVDRNARIAAPGKSTTGHGSEAIIDDTKNSCAQIHAMSNQDSNIHPIRKM